MKKFTKTWLIAALTRAIRTIAQTALSMFSVGMALSEVKWMSILSVSVVAGIYSILTSIVTGLPESTTDGNITMTEEDGEKTYDFNLEIPEDEIEKRETITFVVNTKKE